jgi:hypothetical protein
LSIIHIECIVQLCREQPGLSGVGLSAFRSPRSDPTVRGHRVAQTGFQRYAGFRSREEHTSAEKVLSAMRQGFGGHIEASPQDSSRKGDKA